MDYTDDVVYESILRNAKVDRMRTVLENSPRRKGIADKSWQS